MKRTIQLLSVILIALSVVSCGGSASKSENKVEDGLSGSIKIDGSSTVYPITEAVAEEYRKIAKDVRVTIGISGTGGGFKKFSRAEIDINDASRAIKDSEIAECEVNGVDFLGLQVAYDGLAVIVNPENDWVDYFTVEELKMLWEPDAQEKILKWNQIRPEWPDEQVHLYGPGIASGTYDYFTEAIVGKSGSSRGDFTASEDDNILVQGISTDKYALGFFGLAYFEENKDKLKLVGVDSGNGAVIPTLETVSSNEYAPLSRPVFIYVNEQAAHRPEVRLFVEYYLENVGELSKDVGYIPLPDSLYSIQSEKFKKFGI